MKLNRTIFGLFVALLAVGSVSCAFLSVQATASSGATATANATATVIASLQLSKQQDLSFGECAAGDPAKTVQPDGTLTPNQGGGQPASFAVTGQPNHTYTIALPADGTVVMTTGAGGANQTIAVNGFVSSPSATGAFDGTGASTLKVGAARAALSGSQQAGLYSGTFTVTVAYP
jgi:spore coat protein U-like protein